MNEQNPCLNCTIVNKPKNCERKGCGAWRKWWSTRWDNMRSRYCDETTDEEQENEDGK